MAVKIKKSVGAMTFDVANAILMIILCVTTLYPFLYLLSLSLSPGDVSFTQIHIIPPKVTFDNIYKVLINENIGYGFKNTLTRTLVGTLLTVAVSVFTAYPLSKKYFPNRSFWTKVIVLTMFLDGGLIPNYLLVKRLGLMDTPWALILPGLINTYNMIIARNFFMSLPESLEESAKIDGANELLILFEIIIPTSAPIIATLALWTAVWHWNAWFDSLIYMTKSQNQVLQIVMRRIVLEGTQQMIELNAAANEQKLINPESIKAATIIVTTVPIIAFYPFLQKYFVKGILVGSLKG